MTGKYKALIVGVSGYASAHLGSTLDDLRGAEKDRTNMIEALCDPTCGLFERENVRSLPAEAPRDRDMSPVTGDEFEAAFAWLFDAEPGDKLLFYFGGHAIKGSGVGIQEQIALQFSDTKEDTLRPSYLGTIHERVNKSKADSIIMILDCCYAGVGSQDTIAIDTPDALYRGSEPSAERGEQKGIRWLRSTFRERARESDKGGDYTTELAAMLRKFPHGGEELTTDVLAKALKEKFPQSTDDGRGEPLTIARMRSTDRTTTGDSIAPSRPHLTLALEGDVIMLGGTELGGRDLLQQFEFASALRALLDDLCAKAPSTSGIDEDLVEALMAGIQRSFDRTFAVSQALESESSDESSVIELGLQKGGSEYTLPWEDLLEAPGRPLAIARPIPCEGRPRAGRNSSSAPLTVTLVSTFAHVERDPADLLFNQIVRDLANMPAQPFPITECTWEVFQDKCCTISSQVPQADILFLQAPVKMGSEKIMFRDGISRDGAEVAQELADRGPQVLVVETLSGPGGSPAPDIFGFASEFCAEAAVPVIAIVHPPLNLGIHSVARPLAMAMEGRGGRITDTVATCLTKFTKSLGSSRYLVRTRVYWPAELPPAAEPTPSAASRREDLVKGRAR